MTGDTRKKATHPFLCDSQALKLVEAVLSIARMTGCEPNIKRLGLAGNTIQKRKKRASKKKTEKKVTEIQEQKDDKLENLVIRGKKEVNRADNLFLFNTFFFVGASARATVPCRSRFANRHTYQRTPSGRKIC